MSGEPFTDITTTVFCARKFFESRANGLSSDAGELRLVISLPHVGITSPPPSSLGESLTWIDGAYAQSLQRETFIDAIRRGEVPEPIIGLEGQASGFVLIHTSPAVLARSPRTILSTLNLTSTVADVALQSKENACVHCGATLSRFPQPMNLLERWEREWSESKITVSVEANDPKLAEWGQTRGYTVRSSDRYAHHVTLDTLVYNPSSIAPLARALQTLWRIPKAVLACASDSSVKRYARDGWCDNCATVSEDVTRRELARLLENGLASDQEQGAELGLTIDRGLTIRELLAQPIHSLQLTTEALHPLTETAAVLTTLGLSRLAWGEVTTRLSASALSHLALGASLYRSARRPGVIVIDQPTPPSLSRLLLQEEAKIERHFPQLSMVILGESATQAPIGLSQPPSPAGRELGTLTISSHSNTPTSTFTVALGSRIRVAEPTEEALSLFSQVTDALSAGIHTARVSWSGVSRTLISSIPLFPKTTSQTRLVLDELGLSSAVARLFAASMDARALGLAAKDFVIAPGKRNPHLCPTCRGLGVLLTPRETLPRPLATPCHTCEGLRCKRPLNSILFRGITLATLLNQPIAHSIPLISTLSKSAKPLALLHALELTHLPLGMPIALLSSSEARAMAIIAALIEASPLTPVIIVLEEGGCGLTHTQRMALDALTLDIDLNAAWIEIGQQNHDNI